jgi:hypothetical protein
MVVDQHEPGPGRQCTVRGEDRLVTLRRGEGADIQLRIRPRCIAAIAGSVASRAERDRLADDQSGQAVQRGRDPDREVGPVHPQGGPRGGDQPARPVPLPGTGQLGRPVE